MVRHSARGRSAELTLPPKSTSPARARRFVGDTLAGWRVEDGDDVVLVVSELVTNALLHARTPMTVHLDDEEKGTVRLAVTDASPQALQERHFSVDSGTGRGLRLLASLASEWGVEWHDGGKTVWCRVPLGRTSYAEFDVDAVEAL